MRIKPLFAWYDLWIGAFWDRKARKLYVLPVPCLGVVISFAKPREWLVIEDSRKNSVFSPDDMQPTGYIPRDVAEELLARDLGGTCWFTPEDSAKMKAHPEWRTTAP